MNARAFSVQLLSVQIMSNKVVAEYNINNKLSFLF